MHHEQQHATASTSFINRVEEEFGSLKRALDRRAAQRGGIVQAPDENDPVISQGRDSSGTGVAEGTSLTSREYLHAKTDVGVADRLAYKSDVPAVAHAAATHNAVLTAHGDRWTRGRDKLSKEYSAIDDDSASLQRQIKESQESDPPAIDSRNVTSNMQPVTELLRGAAAILDDPAETSIFAGLGNVFEADYTAREKQFLKIVQQQSSKIQLLTSGLQTAQHESEQALEMHALEIASLKERQSEALQDLQETADYERKKLQDELNSLEESRDMLQKANKEQSAAAQRRAEEARKKQEETVQKYTQECRQWEQTVAQLDREKYDLVRSVKSLEAAVSEKSSAQADEANQMRVANQRLQERAAALEDELRALQQHADSIEEALQLAMSKRVSRPSSGSVRGGQTPLSQLFCDTVDVEVSADTDELIRQLRDEQIRLGQQVDSQSRALDELKRANGVLSRAKASLELEKMESSALLVNSKTIASELVQVTKRQRRDHRRRMELVCENYVLRNQIAVLTSSHGVSDRLEQLTAERHWLQQKLQHAVPLRVNLSSNSTVNRADGDVEDLRQANGGNVIFVRDIGIQFSPDGDLLLLGIGPLEDHRRPATRMWKSQSTQASQDDITISTSGASGLQLDKLRRYLHAHEGYGKQVMQSYLDLPLDTQQQQQQIVVSRRSSTAAPFHRPSDAGQVRELGLAPGIAEDDGPLDDEGLVELHFKSATERQKALAGGGASQHRPPSAAKSSSSTPHPSLDQGQQEGGAGDAVRGDDDPRERRISPIKRDMRRANHSTANPTSGGAVGGSGSGLPRGLTVTGRAHDVTESAFLGNPCNYSVTKKKHGIRGARGLQQEQDLQNKDLQHKFTEFDISAATTSRDPSLEASYIPTRMLLSSLAVLSLDTTSQQLSGSMKGRNGSALGSEGSRQYSLRPATPQMKYPAGAWRPATAH